MKSAGSVSDVIDLVNGKAIQKVDNNYNELATPIETPLDAEDIEKFKYLTVESGGTLYFKTLDEFDVAIPTTETFAIKTGGAN